ncbi:MAG: hypothetical protein WB493_10865 [Anaeromyxobacteraceae bacterium]
MHRGILLSTLFLAACATAPAVSPGVQLDPSTRPACAANCEKMGLELAAVVLVRNSAGCVCAVPEAKPRVGLGGPAAAGTVAVAGGVLIADEEAARSAQAIDAQNQQIQQQIQVGQ